MTSIVFNNLHKKTLFIFQAVIFSAESLEDKILSEDQSQYFLAFSWF